MEKQPMASFSKVDSETLRDLCEKSIAYFEYKIEKIREDAIEERMKEKKSIFRNKTYSREEAEKNPNISIKGEIDIYLYSAKISKLEDLISLSNLSKEVYVSVDDLHHLGSFG